MISLMETAKDFMDCPTFNWKSLVIGFTVSNFLFDTYVKYRQIRCVEANGDKIPKELANYEIDSETVIKSSNYSLSKLKFSIFSSAYNVIENIAFYQFDVLPKVWTRAGSILNNLIQWFPSLTSWIQGSIISQSLVFMGIFMVISIITNIPIKYYQNFVLEESYGFNKLTIKLWISDTIKQFFLTCILGGPILAAFLKIIDIFGDSFMYYLSVFLFIVQIFFIIVYPKFIQPLFNTLTPLEDGELKTEIEKLAKVNKFPLDKLYVIDGSKRSGHSNAYFMGLPWGSKQIVLYDTLINHSTIDEVVSVLGHEIGHWKLNHTTKLMTIGEFHMFMIFSIFAVFIENKSFYKSFGFGLSNGINEMPVLIGFLLFGDVLKPLDAVMEFIMNLITRTYEYQADKFAAEQGLSKDLKTALVTLHKENLSSLVVDALYSAKEYNHPTLGERIGAIDAYLSESKKEK
jgi:STE24 endopeptidase